ncbi:MAG: hypothetical protein SNJ82_03395 [Gemmataceae bacterium]
MMHPRFVEKLVDPKRAVKSDGYESWLNSPFRDCCDHKSKGGQSIEKSENYKSRQHAIDHPLHESERNPAARRVRHPSGRAAGAGGNLPRTNHLAVQQITPPVVLECKNV